MTLTLEVYDKTNTTLVGTIAAGEWREARHAEVASAAGFGGPVVIPHIVAAGAANPALALIQTGRVIRFLHDGVCRFAMLIEDQDVTVVSPDEEAGEVTVVSGRGILAAAAKVQVRPDPGTGVLPWAKRRFFNHSAVRLRDDDAFGPQGVWPTATNQAPAYDTDNWFGRPEGYVDTSGEWFADRDSRTAYAPGGVWYYRGVVTLTEDYDDVLIQGAFDDEGETWVQGVPVLRAEGVYKGGCVQAVIPMSAGRHLISGWVRNLNELRTGALVAGWTTWNGMADTLLFRLSASNTRVLGFPTSPPGFTPTEVIRLFVDESQNLTPARLSHVTFSFISASDTDHVALTEMTDIVADAPGATGYTLIEQLAASYLDVGVDYSQNGLRLDAWVRGTRGIDRSAYIIFAKGSCRKVAWDIGGSERATVALVTGSDFAPFTVTHADAATTSVYEEVSLDFGDASATAAQKYAEEYLDIVSQARKGVTLEILPTDAVTTNVTQSATNVTQAGTQVTVGASTIPQPYVDFQIGDTITVPGSDGAASTHRVAAIAASVGKDDVTRWEIDLEHPRAVLQERLDAIMRRQLPGAAGGRSILPTPTLPSFPAVQAGSERTHTWQFDGAAGNVVLRKNGTAIAGATVTSPAAGATSRVTLTDGARKFVKGVDKLTFVVGSGDASPEWVPPEGRWVQELRATRDASQDTTTVTVMVA